MTREKRGEVRRTDTARLTVAQVVSGLGTGGAEMVLYRYISHIDPACYNWICISYTEPTPDMRRKLEEKGCQVYQIAGKRENLLKSCRELWHILRENHVQIVHAHLTYRCFVANLTAMAAGVKVRIAHAHSTLYPGGAARPAYWLCKKLSAWTSTVHFACNEAAARRLFGEKGARHAVIMRNALDADDFRFDAGIRAEMRKTHGLEGRTVIGHVGRFVEAKNHGFLLRVFAEYHRQDGNSILVLVGEGPLLAQTQEQAARLDLNGSVLFVPPTEEIQRWYMAMDVLLLPSLYEGMPLVALEAQLAGLPVILSSAITREAALSERVRFVALEDEPAVWCEAIRDALSEGRGGDLREELRRRRLDITREAPKLDHFYQNGTWE